MSTCWLMIMTLQMSLVSGLLTCCIPCGSSKPVVLKWGGGDFATPGDIWRCLDRFFIVMTGLLGGDVLRHLVGAGSDAAESSPMHRAAPAAKNALVQIVNSIKVE